MILFVVAPTHLNRHIECIPLISGDDQIPHTTNLLLTKVCNIFPFFLLTSFLPAFNFVDNLLNISPLTQQSVILYLFGRN